MAFMRAVKEDLLRQDLNTYLKTIANRVGLIADNIMEMNSSPKLNEVGSILDQSYQQLLLISDHLCEACSLQDIQESIEVIK